MLKEHMKLQGMDDFTTERGTILYSKKVEKPTSCNKKLVREYLNDIEWKKVDDPDQLTEQIFSKIPEKEHESLKRQKIKKTKEPKEPKEPKEKKVKTKK